MLNARPFMPVVVARWWRIAGLVLADKRNGADYLLALREVSGWHWSLSWVTIPHHSYPHLTLQDSTGKGCQLMRTKFSTC
jgi:hypothetical protein